MKLARHGQGPEIFFSLQGEGKHQGRPSVFVRTSRCNLFCEFCDTPYTWNWSDASFSHRDSHRFDRERETLDWTPLQVVDEVVRFPCHHLVLTGGEPLLQSEACAEVARLAREREPRYHVEVETNGTVEPGAHLAGQVDLFTVSPKLAHSGVPRSLRYKSDALEHFARSEKSVFKFVVSDETDVVEIERLVRKHDIDADRVFLMPEGTDTETLAARRPMVAALCLSRGYRFSDRLQITLHGNRRGT